MIVQEPPYEMVALFADLEIQKLFEALIERGQSAGRSCAREFRWRSLRDPRRDTVWREPERALAPFLSTNCRFLILWDHHGSGLEKQTPLEVEERAVARLRQAGVEEARIQAVCFSPEIERVLKSVWSRVKTILGDERRTAPPADSLVLNDARQANPGLQIPEDLDAAWEQFPKELFEGLIRLVRMRKAAPLYERIGSEVSLPAVKRDPGMARIAEVIAAWFPPER